VQTSLCRLIHNKEMEIYLSAKSIPKTF
jgi:hypothetical protein